MPHEYTHQIRDRVLSLVKEGCHNGLWSTGGRHPARIGTRQVAGVTSRENGEYSAARRWIQSLEQELEGTRLTA
ncbi:hypothetical protein SAMN02910418_00479 [Bowdeniella nasicola]|uniref:Uncharacterized protein n=1 Tax=Bowdeniella nasicola TaxID=208480 RepID=A0A1H3WSK9_9ACTO|nr:hypothetical protein SAMN02910418_00479 [Bowdeniella nasicola]